MTERAARPVREPATALTWRDGQFLRHGEPHRIVAGAMHYFRVHPTQWRDRLERMRALGLNTLDTYVAWNVHQPRLHLESDFGGWNDLGAFIDLAGELGFDVIVRPGAYICAEWEGGGLPYWVTADPDVSIRRSNRAFQQHVERWFDVLVPIIAERQAAHGGPVVAVQIENEYGSYGDDSEYLRWNQRALVARGITELLFTADGGNDYFLDGGSLPDVLATATLGSRGAEAMAVWQRRRPGEPFLAMEFWNGWFDHWGEPHHLRDPQETADAVAEVTGAGGSVCLYMAHGGTNFGFGAGSNHDGVRLQPTTTSYDYDAPIAEDGTLTEKFHALRPVLHAAAGREPAPIPPHLIGPAATLGARTLDLIPGENPLELAREALQHKAIGSASPLTFDELGLPNGLVGYRTEIRLSAPTRLRLPSLADRATIWLDGQQIGELDHTDAADGLDLDSAGGQHTLEILVSAYGRINYGPLTGAPKGLGAVLLDRRHVFGWHHGVLDLAAWGDGQLDGLSRVDLRVDEPADTHLALPDGGRGFVWVGGFLLGRFDTIGGPQGTLYVPAGVLRPGDNRVHVLDLTGRASVVELHERPDLGPVTGDPAVDSQVV